ncbi:type II toxin-antitoxin system RelE/ParE family toxin [Massilia solisilvae]|uniref:Type II toxin-antitoxin system RelE/ParE family toxin n=1 Tax=Massilia solisilvae TaxID=1811225 RepID=A0ABT2BFV6_9BURK|nr:type II toxin-antitoxin system RelE/ParE family toxin [Massilia solisilvae]MCS0607394.1 type II toxin-antitoxin system RelE/ParE family toxin [Massilia solisilvae]
MSTTYLRINFAALGAGRSEPPTGSKPRRLLARCNTEDPGSCDLFVQIKQLAPKDRKAALSALSKLVEVAATGKPITDFYDKKQCHDAYSFWYQNKERTVWRIWKGDVVRITFFYDGENIVLTHAFAKYEDKLTTAQKKMLETEVMTYLDAVKANNITYLEKTLS